MKAYLTREDDRFIPLRDRIKLARKARADIFVSVHADSIRNRDVSGSSVYVLSDKGASSEAARWLASQSIGLLSFREQTAELVMPLHRLGIRTLGAVDRLGRDAMADRFGRAGVLAHALAGGWDTSLAPRSVPERLLVGGGRS